MLPLESFRSIPASPRKLGLTLENNQKIKGKRGQEEYAVTTSKGKKKSVYNSCEEAHVPRQLLYQLSSEAWKMPGTKEWGSTWEERGCR